MEKTLIQDLLQADLLQIGDNDSRLEDIVKTVAALKEQLKTQKVRLPEYTLVALDPHIQDGNQVLIDIESLLVENWKTLRNAIKQRPVPILRAILLEALYQLGLADPVTARIIYLTGINFYPFAQLGKEKPIVSRVLEELGSLAEEDAVRAWSIGVEEPDLKLPALKLVGLKFSGATIDKEALKGELQKAAGTHPTTGHGPQHGNSQWQGHFAETAATGIGDAMKKAFESFGGSLTPSSIETPINKFFSEFKTSLTGTLKASLRPIQSIEQRSRLLWWKETLYSASLKKSYRTVAPVAQPVILAFDLHKQLPAIAPTSVDYLLRETLGLLNPDSNYQKPVGDLLDELGKPDHRPLLQPCLVKVRTETGRISFTSFLARLADEKANPAELLALTGIPVSAELSVADISVMVLHDLMTQSLIPE